MEHGANLPEIQNWWWGGVPRGVVRNEGGHIVMQVIQWMEGL